MKAMLLFSKYLENKEMDLFRTSISSPILDKEIPIVSIHKAICSRGSGRILMGLNKWILLVHFRVPKSRNSKMTTLRRCLVLRVTFLIKLRIKQLVKQTKIIWISRLKLIIKEYLNQLNKSSKHTRPKSLNVNSSEPCSKEYSSPFYQPLKFSEVQKWLLQQLQLGLLKKLHLQVLFHTQHF